MITPFKDFGIYWRNLSRKPQKRVTTVMIARVDHYLEVNFVFRGIIHLTGFTKGK
jgi:hypothetical protein